MGATLTVLVLLTFIVGALVSIAIVRGGHTADE